MEIQFSMKKYIEWDNQKKEFTVPLCGCGITINEFFNVSENSERFSIHQYIGKVDVDGNLIYENSSILEIGFSWQKPEDRIKGFFVYDNASLCYVIFDLEKQDYVDYDPTMMQYFKIIDTKQENKLGFIKE